MYSGSSYICNNEHIIHKTSATTLQLLHSVSQKRCHPNNGYNFINSWLIANNSFAAAKSAKFSTKPILSYPPHLKYVAALPWKTYKSKFCTLHAGKTCFECDFLSSIQQISVKYHENKCKTVHHLHGHMPGDAIQFTFQKTVYRLTVLVKPLGCCGMRHMISFCLARAMARLATY